MNRFDHSLVVEDLQVTYRLRNGVVHAVRGVNLWIPRGQRYGLVGESGCGKSTLATTMLGLMRPPGHVDRGSVYISGMDIIAQTEERRRAARFTEVAIVPQGAMNSLNPVIRVRDQFRDTIRAHTVDRSTRASIESWIHESLDRVGLAASVADAYPHELSGGMKQRVCIALSLLLDPSFVIADEPTSALDVITARSIMDLLIQEQSGNETGLIVIGHDIALIASSVDRIGVMYAGLIVETGPASAIYREPLHPYTKVLIGSLPSIYERRLDSAVQVTEAAVSSGENGCPFASRCSYRMDECTEVVPLLNRVRPDRWVACHLYDAMEE